MNCTYCGCELEDQGPYGYLASHQSGEVLGRVFKCVNNDGFQNEVEVADYLERTGQKLEDLNVDRWEDATCDSGMHHVSGSFYTDKNNNLHVGYPC